LLDAKNLGVKQSIPFLKKLTGLEHLYLENVSKVPENLEQLTQLKELVLRLRMTNKEDIESLFASIKAVPSLNMLQVYGIKSVPSNIGEVTGLTTLNLRGNFLKTLPEEIKGLGKLKLLDLQINSFPDEEKARIKKLLPNTEIKF
jgi:Leucine-rich repeat (LRR) protein